MWAASDGEASATWWDGPSYGSAAIDEFNEARDVCCEGYSEEYGESYGEGETGARGRGRGRGRDRRDGGAGGGGGRGGGGGAAEEVEGCGTVIWGESEGDVMLHT